MAAQVISFHCVLKNKLGQVISSTTARDVLTEGQTIGVLPALALALKDVTQGERRTINLRAEDAYGFYDPKLCVKRWREELMAGEGIREGEQVRYKIGGVERLCRVTDATENFVTLDANHPLAGQDLVFEIEALEARDATAGDFYDEAPVGKILH
jgi:FKBP-type peptidyl-prolyl cis-trans isomerase SlyD